MWTNTVEMLSTVIGAVVFAAIGFISGRAFQKLYERDRTADEMSKAQAFYANVHGDMNWLKVDRKKHSLIFLGHLLNLYLTKVHSAHDAKNLVHGIVKKSSFGLDFACQSEEGMATKNLERITCPDCLQRIKLLQTERLAS